MVPSDFYQNDERLLALMVEVRRDLYMDEQSGEKLPEFGEIRDIIRDQLAELPGFMELCLGTDISAIQILEAIGS